MKHSLPLVVAITLWTLPTFLEARTPQEPTPEQEKQWKLQRKLMPHTMRIAFFVISDGYAQASYYLEDGDNKEFQSITGTTDDQYEQFSDFMLEQTKRARPIFDKFRKQFEDTDDPKELEKLGVELEDFMIGLNKESTKKMDEIITPEQLAKIRQLELQQFKGMAEVGFPIINYDAYKGLGLSDRQKEELHEIGDGFREEQLGHLERMLSTMNSPADRKDAKKMQELAKIGADNAKNGKALNARIKAKVLTILTDEQTRKLENLLANVPDFIQKRRARMGVPPAQTVKNDDWKESWKPGDPLPEHIRQREKAKRRVFPMPR